MVNFDVCKKAPKLIGYHSKVFEMTNLAHPSNLPGGLYILPMFF